MKMIKTGCWFVSKTIFGCYVQLTIKKKIPVHIFHVVKCVPFLVNFLRLHVICNEILENDNSLSCVPGQLIKIMLSGKTDGQTLQ